MMAGLGYSDRYLTDRELESVVSDGLGSLPVDGRRVLVIIPDGTRTMPMPLVFTLLEKHLGPRVAALDFLVALGTHMPMSDTQLSALVGREVRDGWCGKARVLNHLWSDSATFAGLSSNTTYYLEVQAINNGGLATAFALTGATRSTFMRALTMGRLTPERASGTRRASC